MSALALIGTDTGVGKTHVCLALAAGLRRLGHRVWLHKPVACGGWEGGTWPDGTAEDARALAAARGDGQPEETLCPRQYPAPIAPYLAAAQVGQRPLIADYARDVLAIRSRAQAEAGTRPIVLVETAGGLLAPIAADRGTNADLLLASDLPVILVTRPFLGTINHTALTLAVARQRGIRVLGLVVNWHRAEAADPATAGIAHELEAANGLSVLAELPFGPVSASDAVMLAQALMNCRDFVAA